MADDPAANLVAPRQVDVHLHWTEYYQGEWTDGASSAQSERLRAVVADTTWSPNDERVHVTHEGDALLVHVSGQIDQAFRIRSKNSPPVPDVALEPPAEPYSPSADGPLIPGSGPLSVSYVNRIVITDGSPPHEFDTTETILGQGDDYTLRTAGNPLTAMGPRQAALLSPMFYQDGQNTFYVEPALTDTALESSDDSRTPVRYRAELAADTYWDQLELVGQVPVGADPVPFGPIASVARYRLQPRVDWLIRPGATVVYDGSVVHGHPAPAGTTLLGVAPQLGGLPGRLLPPVRVPPSDRVLGGALGMRQATLAVPSGRKGT
jgi:hypothetical protein